MSFFRMLCRIRCGSGAALLVAGLMLLMEVPQAFAARLAIVLSEDSAPYQEAYQALRAQLDHAPHDAVLIYAGDLSVPLLGGAQLVVAIGVRAAEAVAALPIRTPVLAAMVPRAWYLKSGRSLLADSSRREQSVIFIDQPHERQAALIRLALPEARRIGVVLGSDQPGVANELAAALQAQRLSLVPALLSDAERLLPTLEGLLPEVDLLLAIANPLVFSRATAQSLFLTTYRYRVPVLGYSRSMTRAGALLSLYSSPEQIGRQAGEIAAAALQGSLVRLPAPAYPAYFSISVNEKVARSLGVALMAESELAARMGARP